MKMPRKRRYTTDFLKNILDEYLVYKSDYRKIRVSDVVIYCNEKYNLSPPLNYQDFTRNPEIKKIIDDYNNTLESKIIDKDGELLVNRDFTLDVREFYGLGFAQLEKKISTINEHLKRVSNINSDLITEINKTRADNRNIRSEKISLEKKTLELETELEKIKKEKHEVSNQLKVEKQIKAKLYDYIKVHITDPIVQQHLVDIGMLKKEDVTIEIHNDVDMEDALVQFYSSGDTILSKEETDILERLNKL